MASAETSTPSRAPQAPRIVLAVIDLLGTGAAFQLFGILGAVAWLLLLLPWVRTATRVRGAGWLTCPNCGENASQDVVDEMTFLALLAFGVIGWLRLSPVRRRRVLVCRRCTYRRPAGTHSLSGWVVRYGTEMSAIDTAGQPIRHAWMVPMGAILTAAAGLAAYVLIFATPNSTLSGITFTNHPTAADKANPKFHALAGDITFDTPSTGNYIIDAGAIPPVSWGDTSGQNLNEGIIRDDSVTTLHDLVWAHYLDAKCLCDVGFPAVPPAGVCTTIGGQTAYQVTMKFNHSGQDTVVLMYVTLHNHVGYVISFEGSGKDGMSTIEGIARHVVAGIHFSGSETPAPTPSMSPSPSPGATPAASPSPGPSASATPGSTASPSPSPSPSPSGPAINC